MPEDTPSTHKGAPHAQHKEASTADTTATEARKREDERYKGDVNNPSPELVRQIAQALHGGEQTPAVKRWLDEHSKYFPPTK
jgi:hypothetical protein